MPWWVLLLTWVGTSWAHVRLTFPPARLPESDFLSTANSQLPCGVPKPPIDSGLRTFLKAGSTVDLEWLTAIPHQGGIRLEVLNSLDEPIAIFTNFLDPYNITKSSKQIALPPQFECANCAIRITHQATEYGDDYFFYSCADKSPMETLAYRMVPGKMENVTATPDTLEITANIQVADCSSDSDCGRSGLCQSTPTSASKQCFCTGGLFGEHCQKVSSLMKSPSEFDETLYSMREVEDNKIYWRIVNDEIEFVLRYPGQSWAAIGWKPQDYECPRDEPRVETSAGTTTTVGQTTLQRVEVTRPTTTTKPSTSAEVTESVKSSEIFAVSSSITTSTAPVNASSSEECGPNEQWSKCPETSRDCEPSCDWTRFPETIPNCPRSCGTPRCICKEGYVRMTNDEEVCVPFEFCDKEAEPSCPTNSTWAKCGTACEPSCANMYDTAPCPATCEKSACTYIDSHFSDIKETTEVVQVPAVSVDVPIQTAPRTTTTTQNPESLKCAVNETIVECGRVCEPDCVSIFSRTDCDKCGTPACACMQGYARNPEGVCVYWGDCSTEGEFFSDVQIGEAHDFFSSFGGDVCYGDFRYPPGCSDCDYKLSWNYIDETDEIEFSLETKLMTDSWTGLGLSKDGSMVNRCCISLKSLSGRVRLASMHTCAEARSKKDSKKNAAKQWRTYMSYVDSVYLNRFISVRRTCISYQNDKSFVGKCWKMMFPVSGGQLDENGDIIVNSTALLLSDKEVCIKSCREEEKKDEGNAACQSSFRHPAGCTGEDCEYVATWAYNDSANEVRFEISSKNIGRWTGIGFSKDGQMTNSDIYTGWVYEGKAFVTDRFAYGRQLPAIDPADRQDIYDIGGKIEDEIQTLWFRRAVHSKDRLTDYPLDQCWYFLFPIGGGRVLARKSSDFTNPRTPIGYHDLYQPRVSPNKICICDAAGKRISEAPSRLRRQALAAPAPKSSTPNAMECTDMVVGTVVNGRGRVQDFYTPSKASPRPDTVFGGSDSLTAASAFNEDGLTTVVFRKKLRGKHDFWDHTISGPMTVIWAKGADPNNYQHTTGGAPIQADPNFFSASAFKYHGRNHRGMLTIDFQEGSAIFSDTRGGTNLHKMQYAVWFVFDGFTDFFFFQARTWMNEWTAIGFSLDGAMAGSDVIIVGRGLHSEVTVTDQFMPGYGRPIVDEQQDIFDVETAYDDGVVMANFSRELYSSDEHDINLQQCVYLLFTPGGGKFEPSGELRKHGDTPIASRTKICLNTCSELPTKISTKVPEGERKDNRTTIEPTETKTDKPTVKPKTTTEVRMPPLIKPSPPFVVFEPTEPIKSRYGLRVRILNKEYVPALSDPQTEYYQSFTKTVTDAINDLLAKRWKGMQVSKIVGYSKGSVIAEFEVVSVGDVPRPIEVKSLIEETAIRGNIGELTVEPSTIKAHVIGNKLRKLFSAELSSEICEEDISICEFFNNLIQVEVPESGGGREGNARSRLVPHCLIRRLQPASTTLPSSPIKGIILKQLRLPQSPEAIVPNQQRVGTKHPEVLARLPIMSGTRRSVQNPPLSTMKRPWEYLDHRRLHPTFRIQMIRLDTIP
ncbi:unnamed protein product [Cylicocyclus nassatus]|uniref:Uncharacterized protein n=1 Tax=Cylicocyclus nassatus TaxID=53992 RepID=A0AA36HC75_CYLNA|nr:unnamed protein product [Cylicocyclus nassatus]